MMTNHELMAMAHREHIPLVAVYSKDRLPKYPEHEGGYIFNLQNSVDEYGKDLDGSHWTCAYVEKLKSKRQAVYFDSFGIGPPIAVQNFLQQYSPYPYNNDDIQNLDSGWCGLYCLYVIWFLSHHKKSIPNITERFKVLLKQFKDDPEKNLTLLKKYIQEINARRK